MSAASRASPAGCLRAATYVRYSSDAQRDASIEDQQRVCNERLAQQSWTLIHAYADHACSGATTLRPGFQALLASLQSGTIDVVVAESLDRFSRDLEHIAAFHKQCLFHGVRLHTLSEGDVSELHIGLKGTMGALYLKDLADKTRRGLEGRIRAGRCTGTAPYGYTVVRKLREDGELDRGLRAIDDAAAAVVRRIFKDYAAGASPLRIAKALNAEQVAGPGGGIWYETSIRGREARRDGILRNALYVGRIVWRRRLSLKDPVTGARLRRDAASQTYVTGEAQELRIIDDDLWDRVQARLLAEAAPPRTQSSEGGHAFWDRRRPRHLLSGKIICGVCGGPYHPTGSDYLGCQAAKCGACSNRRTCRRAALEAHVLDLLERQLMQPGLLGAFMEAFDAEWERLDGELKGQAAMRQRERQAIDRKIANLVDAVSDGRGSPSILAKLRELEAARLAQDAIGAPEPIPRGNAPRACAVDMAAAYTVRIEELRASLWRGDDPEALEIARQLIDQVIVHPLTDDDPHGVTLIGNLIDLLRAAEPNASSRRTPRGPPDHALKLFALSVKEGPGAEPLALPCHPTRAITPPCSAFSPASSPPAFPLSATILAPSASGSPCRTRMSVCFAWLICTPSPPSRNRTACVRRRLRWRPRCWPAALIRRAARCSSNPPCTRMCGSAGFSTASRALAG
jgi:DNA invertase Pin-like site-specific DNA recombinase